MNGITGLSEKGPLATVEGANTVIIENSTMQSDAEARGILLHQSNSGDAEGTKPVCTITNYTLTVGSSSGSGTINETTGIVEIESSPQAKLEAKLKVQDEIYTLDGRRADGTQKGLLIKKGKKYIAR